MQSGYKLPEHRIPDLTIQPLSRGRDVAASEPDPYPVGSRLDGRIADDFVVPILVARENRY